MFINAGDERGIDVIREKIKPFSSSISFKNIKVVILDEAESLTTPSQLALKTLIEETKNVRFILTSNIIEKIISPLKSRCYSIKIVPPSKKEIAIRLTDILNKEKISFELESLANIVNRYYPDIRLCFNTIQSNTINNNLVYNNNSDNSNYDDIIKELSNNKPSWDTIRNIITNIGHVESIFDLLYNKASLYSPGNEGTISILIAEHQYYNQFAVDKEINTMALIQKIINIKI
jgi:DNA polymerase III delta prime subunit